MSLNIDMQLPKDRAATPKSKSPAWLLTTPPAKFT
jgi:hypothetical protein